MDFPSAAEPVKAAKRDLLQEAVEVAMGEAIDREVEGTYHANTVDYSSDSQVTTATTTSGQLMFYVKDKPEMWDVLNENPVNK